MREGTAEVSLQGQKTSVRIREWTRQRKQEILNKSGLSRALAEGAALETRLDRRAPQEAILNRMAEASIRAVEATNVFNLQKLAECVIEPRMTVEAVAALPDSEFNDLLWAVDEVLERIPDRLGYFEAMVRESFAPEHTYTGEQAQNVVQACIVKAFDPESLKNLSGT